MNYCGKPVDVGDNEKIIEATRFFRKPPSFCRLYHNPAETVLEKNTV